MQSTMSAYDTPNSPRTTGQPNKSIQLTPEELAVIMTCNAEGMSRRGVPGGFICGIASFYAMKAGLVKPNAKFGMVPMLCLSTIAGCVIGTLSYKSICLERVLALPNGTLRKQMEAMQLGTNQNVISPPQPSLSENFELAVQKPMVSGSQMDVYQSSNNFDGFTGVNTDGDQLSNYDTVKPLPSYSPGIATYDELRQKNRDEYMRSTWPSQKNPPPRAADPEVRPSGPIFDDTLFDRDRVPQYNLD